MRQCRFCTRWFRNKQGVRRHLGYCSAYARTPRDPAKPDRRRDLYQCAACVASLGVGLASVVTNDEMHDLSRSLGGCPTCRTNSWLPARSAPST